MSNTDKYIINYNKVLGSGATAKVYLGIKSDDGCQYAIKCAKVNVPNSGKMLNDEMEILKDLDSDYIIKCHESLKYFDQIEVAIVMDYCNKGSLYEFTELHQGLCDNMFLKVLDCLNNGISYLRAKEILHRDIKPGNMMVHQDTVGYYHVKIVDLGTAKRIGADQQFKTICGTPEYLHPDMFIRYLGGLSMTFKTNVDLWSTGVTLYHAAVTQLPFQPLKGTKSMYMYENTLKDMYTKKKPGIISGKQMSKDPNDIKWSDTLPDNCRMSPMLKTMASELIGKLMDLSEENTFDRFYKNANRLCQKKRILVFNSVNGELLILYLDSLTYSNVVDQVAASLALKKEEMIILTKNKILSPLSDPKAECLRPLPQKGHLRYALDDDTLLVVSKRPQPTMQPLAARQVNNIECEKPQDQYEYFCLSRKYSEVLMRSIYQVGNAANYIDCQVDCYLATMFAFNQYVLVDDLRLMHEMMPWQMLALRETCRVTETLIDNANKTLSDTDKYKTSFIDCQKEIKRLKGKAEENEVGIGKWYCAMVEQRQLFKYTEQKFYKTSEDIANDNLDFLVHLSEELVNEMKVLPDDKFDKDDRAYKLEIWERHMRMYKYYLSCKERFARKTDRISIIHRYFYDLYVQGLTLMENIDKWKISVTITEDKRKVLASQYSDILTSWKDVMTPSTQSIQAPPQASHTNEVLKLRIREIKEITEQLMGSST